MKTAIREGLEFLDKEIKFITVHDSQEDKYYQAGLKHAYNIFKEKLPAEKQQIIDARIDGVAKSLTLKTNAIDRKQSEDYYTSIFETNKETLK